MDILERLPTLSIAELRKVLKDNDIKHTSQSKEDLIQQVTEFCLTKITMDELVQEYEPEQDTNTIQENVFNQDTTLIQEQNKEYAECCQKDLERQSVDETIEELSPRSLRMKRVSYYSN